MAPVLDTESVLGLQPWVALAYSSIFTIIAFTAYSIIYNLFLSPLSKIPGPKLWAISGLPYAYMHITGQGHKRVRELHEKYGDAVRVAPRIVVFRDARSWKQLLGHRKAGTLENLRDPVFFEASGDGVTGPVSTAEHARQRRILSHGFSAQSMVDQYPLIRGYVDLLMQRLRENSKGGAVALDMTRFYNYTTFDIIGDLAFGEPFGCLDDTKYHPWVSLIFDSIKQRHLMTMVRRNSPALERLIKCFAKSLFVGSNSAHEKLVQLKCDKRIARVEPRPDFMEAMLSIDPKGGEKLSMQQIRLNASLLIVAGSETTATALSGATFLLGRHPEILAKLTQEVRSSFASVQEITLLSVQNLKYMLAVLDESLRLFPPVPSSLPRVMRKGGDVLCDVFVPEDTVVELWQYPMFRSPKNFTLPDSFIPERWLGDARFDNDKREAVQPFSFGPRNCLGKNLAYAEMRMILARVIFSFDIELAEPQVDWIDSNDVYMLWDKNPLMVYLKPRKEP
ncbi:cytochrome P450 monooxygenase [Coniella lustricola]|uniref:Cytochrome P450 monooxygenase n=1 Tax=Coniella lustricola TaxID=2025994 RepID=A0A2T3AGE9_9PEZI|nr:cytochrome P450 monooxygenase [Coniella lustricola]